MTVAQVESFLVDLGRDVAWDFLPRFGATAGNVLTQASAGFDGVAAG